MPPSVLRLRLGHTPANNDRASAAWWPLNRRLVVSKSASPVRIVSIDAALLVLAALFASVSLTFPFGRDQGIWYYMGRMWLHGQVPYRDAIDFIRQLSRKTGCDVVYDGTLFVSPDELTFAGDTRVYSKTGVADGCS